MNYNPRSLNLWKVVIGVLVGIPAACIGGLIGQFNGATAQGVYQMDINTFLFFSTAIERAIEGFKRAILMRVLPDIQTPDGSTVDRSTLRRDIAFVVSMLVGLFIAGLFNLNMFASLGAAYALPGTLLTGLIVGGGSNMVHRAFELLAQLSELFNARVELAQNQAALLLPEPTPSNAPNRSAHVYSAEMPKAG